MPIINSQPAPTIGNFDASVFLRLASNPVEYQAKLDELNALIDKAREEQEKAKSEYILVGQAHQIATLLEQAKVDRENAITLLNSTQQQVDDLLANTSIAIKEQWEKANAIEQEKIAELTKQKEILNDQENFLRNKEQELNHALATTRLAQQEAEVAQRNAEKAILLSQETVKKSNDYLIFIKEKFDEFILAVKK